MGQIAMRFTLLLLSCALATCMQPLNLHLRNKNRIASSVVTAAGTNRTQWIAQPLDHFEPNAATWQQRYLINSSFFDGTGPVFLCVGGEGPGFTEDVVVTGTEHAHEMILAAQKHKALILALEHRYYGQSLPTRDFTTANLKWLSSQQALADLAKFVSHINEAHKLTSNNRWITFGGSYPGMMASFARLKYPHLIHGAIASSAPVQAVSNMQGYMNVMSDNFKLADVGGSDACHDAIKEAFTEVGKQLEDPAGRRSLYHTFDICQPETDPLAAPEQQTDFTQSLSFLFPAQSNDPLQTTPGANIKTMCSAFLTNTSLGQPLGRVARCGFGRIRRARNMDSIRPVTRIQVVSSPPNRTPTTSPPTTSSARPPLTFRHSRLKLAWLPRTHGQVGGIQVLRG